jgi:membrane protein
VFDNPLSWPELARRAWRDALEDDILGQAAQLSYYLFLALFPALLFVLALASFFPLAEAADAVVAQLAPLVSPQVLELIQEQMRRLGNRGDGGLLTFGVAGALWSSSAAMVSIASALNRAYDITEGRPWWKVRLVAIGVTLGVAVFVVLAGSLVLLGPASARWLGEAGAGPVAEWAWRVLQWPLAFALVSTAIGLVYYYAPDAEQDWIWITPGAMVATALWMTASLAFRVYIANFTDYTASYGAVGGVIVLLLWFYVSSLAVLAGAELNAEIEHASPHGKAPGLKTPAGRRLLGPRAARAHAAAPPAPAEGPVARPASIDGPEPRPVTSVVLIVALLLTRAWRRRPPPEPPPAAGMGVDHRRGAATPVTRRGWA